MKTPLHVRLDALNFLKDSDWETLAKLLDRTERAMEGELIVLENQEMNRTRVLREGWAFRYNSLPDGRRQILNLLLPGDIVGFYAIMRNRSDCGVEALTPIDMFVFPAIDLIDALSAAPRLILALSWIAGHSERILDEQITRIGRRNAAERMAHFFVEIYLRLRKADFNHDQATRFPLTQNLLADILGMSHVHANRSFRALARDRGVSLTDGCIVLQDIEYLAKRCKFDDRYLQPTPVPKKTEKAIKNKNR